MKAMILAAGLGTRLRPLTNDRPKALVEVAGRTLLEIAIARVREVGVREVIVNVHHFAGMVTEYLRGKNNFGMRIEISEEGSLLDTGGGLKKAAWFFREEDPAAPFILHNVDVISTIDLRQMLDFHTQNQALATLAVRQRQTSRYLLFDEQMRLCGRRLVKERKTELVRPSPRLQELAFSGIHVISPRLLWMMSEEGTFSIVQSYLRLAGEGKTIVAYRADGDYWRDLGTPESVARATEDMKKQAMLRGGVICSRRTDCPTRCKRDTNHEGEVACPMLVDLWRARKETPHHAAPAGRVVGHSENEPRRQSKTLRQHRYREVVSLATTRDRIVAS